MGQQIWAFRLFLIIKIIMVSEIRIIITTKIRIKKWMKNKQDVMKRKKTTKKYFNI